MRYFFANFYLTLLVVMLAGIVGMVVAAPGPEICDMFMHVRSIQLTVVAPVGKNPGEESHLPMC